MDAIYRVKQFVKIFHVPACVGRRENGRYVWTYESAESISRIGEALCGHLPDTPGPDNMPTILIEKDSILLCRVMLPEDRMIFIGPAQIENSDPAAVIDFIHEYVAGSKSIPHIRSCRLEEISAGILLLYASLTGREISEDEFWRQNGIGQEKLERILDKGVGEVVFRRQEEQMAHNSYEKEVREMESIRRGDVKGLSRALQESHSGKVGKLANDPVRQAKDIAIVIAALASRKAIEGGMNSETSFSMVDGCIQQVEKMNNPLDIYRLMRSMEIRFAEEVAGLRSGRREKENVLINEAKNEIFKKLHGKVNLKDIAERLHVNPSYLSRLFRASEGRTMQQYVLREKVKLAENLLKYSRYPILEIANYLGFCSPSHFSSVFLKETGMTPSAYRKKFGFV